jgi:hypothetical protein
MCERASSSANTISLVEVADRCEPIVERRR